MTFWVRKLKPLRLAPDSPNYLATLNERKVFDFLKKEAVVK